MDDYAQGFDDEGVTEFINSMFPKMKEGFKCDWIDDEGYCGHEKASKYPLEQRGCLVARDEVKTCAWRSISEHNLNA